MKRLVTVVLSALIAVPALGQSREYQGPVRSQAPAQTDQIIVQWRSGAKSTLAASSVQRAGKVSASAGLNIKHQRRSTANTDVFKLDRELSGSELKAVLERLNADTDVAFAVADKRRQIQQIPTDPLALNQWYFLSAEAAATKTDQAWDITTGSSATVVAVLDTGVRMEHPDFVKADLVTSKLLPGYDFVSNAAVANDGDGRDSDPTDPGDWIVAADRSQTVFANCSNTSSSWHGTRVSSLIGAAANNGAGMAGAGWETRILPVRVLGKCGGFDSDIIDGMRWAAGLTVDGVPANPTPANILNMSLGGDDDCSAAYQSAVDEITAQGALIVASVGNDGIPVGTPANCSNVLGVSGVRHVGTKVGYSNLGAGADIAAPAGNCVNNGPPFSDASPCVYALQVALDSGTTVPVTSTYSDRVSNPNFGTSFSAPLVAGAAALMHSVNPQLKPDQFTTLLQESATAFPTSSATTNSICRVPTNFVQGEECICTTVTCGAGTLNTLAAVNAALKPFGIVTSTATINPNVAVNISGSTSFAAPSHSITGYQWSILSVTGATPTITDAAAATTTLQVAGNSRFTLRLRVTDDAGVTDDTDFAMVTATAPETPTTPPTTQIGSGGGGGSFDWWLLVLGLLPLALPGPRRRKTASTPEDSNDDSARGSHRRRRRQHFPK
ncbi:S8 family peptidase [Steroidobacter sp.]|uniref:S8 family peptidase n=1 Tax=Steroidobacter sp. TaxID=1978227 RepID=UPI001A4EBD30|nr:S8 family peptidase [Steroidobacter sp.]MBL8267575.1 S8 family peptidase [Steroidobacter sp.]